MSKSVMATTMALAGSVAIQAQGLVSTPNSPAFTQPADNAQGKQTGNSRMGTQVTASKLCAWMTQTP